MVEVVWVPTHKVTAGGLVKAALRKHFERFMEQMSLKEVKSLGNREQTAK
jgi:hypothetical protein